MSQPRVIFKRTWRAVSLSALALGLASCSGKGGAADGQIGVALILKTLTNPFFIAMQDAAQAEAAKNGVKLTIAAGKIDGDSATEIQAIEDAISRGDKGILITPTDSSVNSAMEKARKAGLYVIALDTPPDPPNIVSATYATDNFNAGVAIGKWAAAKLDGKPAVIGLVDLFAAQVATVDYNRDQGFLVGMGIDPKDKTKKGDEDKSGRYTGGKGGTYTIAGAQAANGDPANARAAMETLLSKNPNINLVYTINEATGYGAYQALKAAGKEKSTILVTIDGGCTGVSQIKAGYFGAASQQYPSKMASMGVDAIVQLVKSGKSPAEGGGEFVDTGTQLVTDQPMPGLTSISSDDAAKICWGKAGAGA